MTSRNIKKAVSFSRRLGIRYFLGLIFAYFVFPIGMAVLPLYAIVYRRCRYLQQYLNLNKEIAYWSSRKEEVLKVGKRGSLLHIDDLGLEEEELGKLKGLLRFQPEVVVADIDQDGFLMSHFGPIEGVPTVSKDKFLTRKRFVLQVVAITDKVMLRKQYKCNRLSFINELSVLHHLTLAGCNVPAIVGVDFDNLIITMSFIAGCTLQEMLAQHGAMVRDKDIHSDPHLMSLSSKQRVRFYFEEGKRLLASVADSAFIDDLYSQLKQVHQAGIELYDIKYGNVMIERTTSKPFLVDFDSAVSYPRPDSKTFSVMRDRDTEKFNLFFNADKLTYKRIKDRIARKDVPGMANLYAPVYFGYGLRIGKLWDVNVGCGRWYFILRDALPSLDGKRILSVGANNGSNEIQMLRHGATEVIGVEIDDQWIAQGRFLKEAFEWADNRPYNFKYIHTDMAKLPSMDLGTFDTAIALCSLYYLDDEDMVRVAQHISTITDTFVVQCNIRRSIGRPDSHSYEKASVEYVIELLQHAGFSALELIAPKGYSRPIVIGKKR